MNELQPLPELVNPIITPSDHERFPLLFSKSQICNIPISAADIKAIQTMHEVLDELDTQAAGLAAIQIGYPKRIFVLRRGGKNETFINPLVIDSSREMARRREGCLSLPNMVFRIRRPKHLTLQWLDKDGRVHKRLFYGFLARAICHEMDHLNGRLLAEHEDSVLVKEKPRTVFRHQEGYIIRDAAFHNRVKKRRAANKRARRQRQKNR